MRKAKRNYLLLEVINNLYNLDQSITKFFGFETIRRKKSKIKPPKKYYFDEESSMSAEIESNPDDCKSSSATEGMFKYTEIGTKGNYT